MLKRELAFAAIAAAVLTAATARVASAEVGCTEDCKAAFGERFYEGGQWVDDAGNLAEPGHYKLSGCYVDGGTTWCEYQHLT